MNVSAAIGKQKSESNTVFSLRTTIMQRALDLASAVARLLGKRARRSVDRYTVSSMLPPVTDSELPGEMIRRQRRVGQLEPHLVVSLSGDAMRHSLGAFSERCPRLAAPRACLSWQLRDFATNRHEECGPANRVRWDEMKPHMIALHLRNRQARCQTDRSQSDEPPAVQLVRVKVGMLQISLWSRTWTLGQ